MKRSEGHCTVSEKMGDMLKNVNMKTEEVFHIKKGLYISKKPYEEQQ